MKTKIALGLATLLIPVFFFMAHYKNARSLSSDFRDAVKEGAVGDLQKAVPGGEDLNPVAPSAVEPAAATTAEETQVQVRMDSGITEAAEACSRIRDALKGNECIEEYYNRHKGKLHWRDAQMLMNGLRRGNWNQLVHKNDGLRVAARITKSFIKRNFKEIDPSTAIEIVRYERDSLDRNSLLEFYYFHRKDSLTWADVKVILSGLTTVGNRYTGLLADDDNAPDVEKRISQDWAKHH